jgi:radical SAM protein with 4Fe4S-binding SPASM domain
LKAWKMPEEFEIEVDDRGCVIIPAELSRKFGLSPGSKARIESERNGLRIRRPITQLAKVYIEPTNHCNLDCVTCIRNSWDERLGNMTMASFSRIIKGLRSLSPAPDIFFGGLGEPLAHPDIVEMVREAKTLGSSVELITNGTLLNKTLSKQLIEAGLDVLWTSLDGATPESYKDVRLGAALPQVLANLTEFRQIRWTRYMPELFDLTLRPHIGIVFVAMKRNIADLPAVLKIANRLGALHVMVTNVLPYTPEMQQEILYSRALKESIYNTSQYARELNFPKMDVNSGTQEVLYHVLRGDHSVTFAGGNLGGSSDRCPFIDKGAVAIRWDGDVSPCLALLHDHKIYFYGYERMIKHHAIGNVNDEAIEQIWKNPEHLSFRRRLDAFNFSPCTYCGGCEYLESNQEDCIGSPVPTCGGCLWAQGIVQCP